MRRHLYPGATFIDVGANVGYVSAMGLGMVGPRGAVHSFEPVPAYHECLLRVAQMNPDYTLIANDFALGDGEGAATIDVPGKTQIGGNSMVPGFVKRERVESTLNVQVKRLDAYLRQNRLSDIALIKIDVEGYELPVLRGASEFFERNRDRLPPIIVEIIPFVYERGNASLRELQEFMSAFGYTAYCICEEHKMDIEAMAEPADVVFRAGRPRRRALQVASVD
jgi:FkbM family methyltransferase